MYQTSERELTLPTSTAKHTNPKLNYLSIRVKLSIILAVNPSSSGLEKKPNSSPKRGVALNFTLVNGVVGALLGGRGVWTPNFVNVTIHVPTGRLRHLQVFFFSFY